jgi:hypothetical protein
MSCKEFDIHLWKGDRYRQRWAWLPIVVDHTPTHRLRYAGYTLFNPCDHHPYPLRK